MLMTFRLNQTVHLQRNSSVSIATKGNDIRSTNINTAVDTVLLLKENTNVPHAPTRVVIVYPKRQNPNRGQGQSLLVESHDL